jgi:hypothetical protein
MIVHSKLDDGKQVQKKRRRRKCMRVEDQDDLMA